MGILLHTRSSRRDMAYCSVFRKTFSFLALGFILALFIVIMVISATDLPIEQSPLRSMSRGSQISCAVIAAMMQLLHWKATRNLATEPYQVVIVGDCEMGEPDCSHRSEGMERSIHSSQSVGKGGHVAVVEGDGGDGGEDRGEGGGGGGVLATVKTITKSTVNHTKSRSTRNMGYVGLIGDKGQDQSQNQDKGQGQGKGKGQGQSQDDRGYVSGHASSSLHTTY